ncbi:MAG: M48 family metallopeptidase [Clostridia bacterium]|nr:M48 family metallopeptidase [Clostridia bacterium]
MTLNLKNKFGEDIVIEYEIVYKRVKNINMRFNGNKLMVSAPRYVSKKEIDKTLDEHKAWLIDAYQIEKEKSKYKLARDLTLDDNEYYFFGEKYHLKFTNRNHVINVDNPNELNNKYFYIDKDSKEILLFDYEQNDKWKKELSKFEQQALVENLKYYLNKSINDMKEYNLPVTKVKIKTLKSAWGVCQIVKKEITINRRLVNHKIDCLHYVIVHELTHLLHADHSKEFYSVVEKFIPNYKKIRKELNYD